MLKQNSTKHTKLTSDSTRLDVLFRISSTRSSASEKTLGRCGETTDFSLTFFTATGTLAVFTASIEKNVIQWIVHKIKALGLIAPQNINWHNARQKSFRTKWNLLVTRIKLTSNKDNEGRKHHIQIRHGNSRSCYRISQLICRFVKILKLNYTNQWASYLNKQVIHEISNLFFFCMWLCVWGGHSQSAPEEKSSHTLFPVMKISPSNKNLKH